MTMRVKLEYQRVSKLVERGVVCVDMEEGCTLAQLYEKAHTLEFSKFLPTEQDFSETQWEFNYVPEPASA